MTYYPLVTNSSLTVEVRYKSNSETCIINDYYCPAEGCHNLEYKQVTIDRDSTGDFCQMESVWTSRGPTNAPMLLRLNPNKWSRVNVNGISTVQGSSVVELRTRSDTGHANASPQTTILPLYYRVPRNCERDIHLLTFDPDGDLVQCRFPDESEDPKECDECVPPSVLSLSASCTLSFRPSGIDAVGLYAVEIMMEDFPRTDMVLTLSDGTQEARKTTDSISRIPVQFVFAVEPDVPSCSSGLYLPRFVTPTPAHGGHVKASVNNDLQIYIRTRAKKSTVSALWFSGPSGMTKAASGSLYVLSWAPSAGEDGRHFPVCFVAEAVLGSAKYYSEPRCLIVSVQSDPSSTAATSTSRFESTSATTDTDGLTTTPSRRSIRTAHHQTDEVTAVDGAPPSVCCPLCPALASILLINHFLYP